MWSCSFRFEYLCSKCSCEHGDIFDAEPFVRLIFLPWCTLALFYLFSASLTASLRLLYVLLRYRWLLLTVWVEGNELEEKHTVCAVGEKAIFGCSKGWVTVTYEWIKKIILPSHAKSHFSCSSVSTSPPHFFLLMLSCHIYIFFCIRQPLFYCLSTLFFFTS